MLVEVLIVVAIMAMLSAGVAVAAYDYWVGAKIKTAQTNARQMRRTIQTWRMDNGGAECPTVARLQSDKALDADSNPKDPWNGSWRILCEDDEIRVSSAGPDGKFDTDDDLHSPRPRTADVD